MHPRRGFEMGLVLLALTVALAPIPPVIVERWFSVSLYPHLQQVLTPFTNLVPFAWFDIIALVAIAGVLGGIVAAARRARRERRWQPLLTSGWSLVVAAAGVYLVFLAVWGMNYRRVPMTQRVELNGRTPGRDDVLQLGMTAVTRLNELYGQAHAIGWPQREWQDASLVSAFHEAQRLLADTPQIVPGRLKRTLLGPYFRWTGVDGMVDPFALEVLVNPDLLPWERPFVASHEWGHLAGFAAESEASFVGWLTCLRGNAAAQYSGWLYVFWEVMGDVSARDRQGLQAALDEGPRRDVAAVVDRLRRGQLPMLRTASWAVYDQYLRANRVDEGIRSYGEVITLILQTRFDDGYRPIRRAFPASTP